MTLTYSINHTAAEWRAKAAACGQRAADSWERSDTDGFLSQWASSSTQALYLAAADLAEEGHKSEFRAVFDLEGNLLDARQVEGRYGWVWLIKLPGGGVAWFNESEAQKPETARRNNAKKGYYLGVVRRPAAVKLVGSCTLHPAYVPLGELFDAEVEVVDSGV